MHDTDLLDPPPTDLDPASDAQGPPEPAGTTDADALLALLRILDAVRDDPEGRLVVWCTDPSVRDGALAARTTAIESLDRPSIDEATIDDSWQDDAKRGACPAPLPAQRRVRRQGRRARR